MTDATEPATEPSTAEPSAPGPARLVLWGFGPLIMAILLALAIVLLVPSVAPEQIVVQTGTEVPADSTTAPPAEAVEAP